MNSGGDSPGIEYGTRVPAPDGRGDDDHVPFIELAERRRHRSRFAVWFLRRQRLVALDCRRWFSVTELADQYAKEPDTLDVDEQRRAQFIDAVRRSILSGEFSDAQRSKVLNVHPSGLAEGRFEVLGASNQEQFNPLESHLWISRIWWIKWLDGAGIATPALGRGARVQDDVVVVPPAEVSAALPAELPYRRYKKATYEQILQAIRDTIQPQVAGGRPAPNKAQICQPTQLRLRAAGLDAPHVDIKEAYENPEFVRRKQGLRKDFDGR
jgi:hypothetical protein